LFSGEAAPGLGPAAEYLRLSSLRTGPAAPLVTPAKAGAHRPGRHLGS